MRIGIHAKTIGNTVFLVVGAKAGAVAVAHHALRASTSAHAATAGNGASRSSHVTSRHVIWGEVFAAPPEHYPHMIMHTHVLMDTGTGFDEGLLTFS